MTTPPAASARPADSGSISQHFRLLDPPRPPRWSRVRAVLRGLLAVLALLVTAVDELVTALLGLPPLTPRLCELGRAITETYRDGMHDVRPADVAGPDDVIGDA